MAVFPICSAGQELLCTLKRILFDSFENLEFTTISGTEKNSPMICDEKLKQPKNRNFRLYEVPVTVFSCALFNTLFHLNHQKNKKDLKANRHF